MLLYELFASAYFLFFRSYGMKNEIKLEKPKKAKPTLALFGCNYFKLKEALLKNV